MKKRHAAEIFKKAKRPRTEPIVWEGGGVELCVFASWVGGWVGGGGELTFDLSANSTAHRNHSGATSTLHWCDQNPVEMIPQWMISHYRPSVSGLLVY